MLSDDVVEIECEPSSDDDDQRGAALTRRASQSDEDVVTAEKATSSKLVTLPICAHESEARYMSTCNCGRAQRLRSDPFTAKTGNYDFYAGLDDDDMAFTCCRVPAVAGVYAFPLYNQAMLAKVHQSTGAIDNNVQWTHGWCAQYRCCIYCILQLLKCLYPIIRRVTTAFTKTIARTSNDQWPNRFVCQHHKQS